MHLRCKYTVFVLAQQEYLPGDILSQLKKPPAPNGAGLEFEFEGCLSLDHLPKRYLQNPESSHLLLPVIPRFILFLSVNASERGNRGLNPSRTPLDVAMS